MAFELARRCDADATARVTVSQIGVRMLPLDVSTTVVLRYTSVMLNVVRMS